MFNPCVVIPHFNHGQAVGAVVEQLAEFELPCFLVDDGSDESHRDVLVELEERFSWLSVVWFDFNEGKGAAMKAGFWEARERGFSHVVQVDADNQHTIGDVEHLLDLAREKPEAVVCAVPEYDHSVPMLRFLARYLTHFWVWVECLSLHVRDSMCGFRVYPLAVCLDLLRDERVGDRMDFDSEILVRLFWRGVEVVQLPSRVCYPLDGVSHFRGWRDNWLISKMHCRLFFGMLWRLPRLVLCRFKSKDSHWSKVAERGSLLGFKLFLWVYRVLGAWALKVCLFPVLFYFFVTGSKARRASQDYLERVAEFDGAGERLSSFRHFMQFADSITDKLAVWFGKIVFEDVVLENRPLFETLVASTQGVVIISAHLGNIEVSRALSRHRPGLCINALHFSESSPRFHEVLRQVNPDALSNMLHINHLDMSSAVMLKEKVDAGEFLVMMGDRTTAKSQERVCSVDFLGASVDLPQGPFILAGLMKCPVYLMFCLKIDGRYHIFLEHFAESLSFPAKQRAEKLQEVVALYARRLEHFCVKAPLQWFNFFDFWRKAKVGS